MSKDPLTFLWTFVVAVGAITLLIGVTISQGTDAEAERQTHVETLTCPVEMTDECLELFKLNSPKYSVQRLVSMDQKEVIFEITECEKR